MIMIGTHPRETILSQSRKIVVIIEALVLYAYRPNLVITHETSSNGNIFRVTGPLCGEFTGPGEFPTQRPVTHSFGVFFDLRLNKRLSKQPWGWWFETPSWSLWRHRNAAPGYTLAPGHVSYLPFRLLKLSKLWGPSFTFNYLKQIHFLSQRFDNLLKQGTFSGQPPLITELIFYFIT